MARISTRNELLDRQLNGGIPGGAIASLVASPASQSSPLFRGFMEDRPWLYVTTYRSREAVLEELDDLMWGNVEIEHVGVDRPVRNLHKALRNLDDERNVIVDTMNPLEETDNVATYAKLLNGLKEYLIETDCVALLHCTEYDEELPRLRETTLTMVDVVLELETDVEHNQVTNRLRVPKCRSTEVVDEVIKLDLGEDVSVDTSKNIA